MKSEQKIMRNSHMLSLLERCKSMTQLKQLHGQMITTAQVSDVIPLSRLLDFCANSEAGDLNYARSVFLHIDRPTVFMWNSMIKGLSNGNEQDRPLSLYRKMQRSGYSPDHFTFPFVLRSCAKISSVNCGRCVHGRIVKTGFEADLYVSSSLIYMYASCADLEAGRLVFEEMPKRNVVSWTTLIAGYVNNNRPDEAIKVFKEMEITEVKPNEITMVNVLVACAETRDLETGRWVHSHLRQIGMDPFLSNSTWNVILATAILDMYAKCGSLKFAKELFDAMPERNVVSWNAMIGAYNQYGWANEAVRLCADMRVADVKLDEVTLLSLLGACAQLGALGLGQGAHAYIEKNNIYKDVAISTSLLDMYAKTGDMHSALQIFHHLPRKDVITWTSMIIGLAMHGHGEDALRLFRQMQVEGILPDHITYIGVLCACSHAGLVDESREYFDSMTNVHGIAPTIEHYGCMVDLLSRAGRLREAEKLVELMPLPPNIAVWSALLSGCEIHCNVDIAERIGNRIEELNPQGSGIYLLLSNIYAKAGRWQAVEMARELMRHKGIEKTHGCSSIEANQPST
ncbi:putative pentatricopeptide repeat-containing protein At3g05240 [Magnolia sinica]|uniref:putative pentatricopeptide repeat-containing protein At3g05240 n=1 Tax=Magnolia sinica TaxID=86752 RepID=UPI0026593C3D|nr:putative pentatricopeptide repeat-containing protein At3g05240 [Magnolia sinica]